MNNPTVHEVAGEDQASSTIDHKVLVVEHRDKTAVIEQLVRRPGKTLVFARTRAYAEQLADALEDVGIPVTSLHGDLNQSRRTRNLQLLTSGRVNVFLLARMLRHAASMWMTSTWLFRPMLRMSTRRTCTVRAVRVVRESVEQWSQSFQRRVSVAWKSLRVAPKLVQSCCRLSLVAMLTRSSRRFNYTPSTQTLWFSVGAAAFVIGYLRRRPSGCAPFGISRACSPQVQQIFLSPARCSCPFVEPTRWCRTRGGRT